MPKFQTARNAIPVSLLGTTSYSSAHGTVHAGFSSCGLVNTPAPAQAMWVGPFSFHSYTQLVWVVPIPISYNKRQRATGRCGRPLIRESHSVDSEYPRFE